MQQHTYARGDHRAVVTGPIKYSSTRGGCVVTLYQVLIQGQRVMHAPARHVCVDWLKRTGWRRMA